MTVPHRLTRLLRNALAALTTLAALLAQTATFQSCATPTAPVGGDRDTIGPVLVPEQTTPNFQTNFRPEEIVLTFDEWVELDPKQEIIISPPVDLSAERPYLRRRSLIIPLRGVDLLDSVTYVVNVGAAVVDLNEGNPTENLRFAFATGPVLDSATVSGILVDDFSGEPLDGATFTLFANLADSATTTVNPTYFAQTDEAGRFTVYNVRPGVYRGLALVRAPGATNYFADLAGTFPPQAIGFPDSLLTVADGANDIGRLRVSPVPRPVRVTDYDTTAFGQIDLVVNQDARLVDYRASRTDYLRRNVDDTLRLFYSDTVRRPDTIYLGREPEMTDTLFFAGTTTGQPRPPRLERTPRGKLGPNRGATLVFDRPLAAVDTSRFVLLQDTLPPLPFGFEQDTTYSGRLRLTAAWTDKASYELRLLPGAVTATNGLANVDTLTSAFRVGAPAGYGTLTLKLVNLDPLTRYILRLVKGENVLVDTRRYVDRRFAFEETYYDLAAGEYTVELLEDTNGNDRYDSGDYRFSRQPEAIYRFDIQPLRANWEVEEVIDLER